MIPETLAPLPSCYPSDPLIPETLALLPSCDPSIPLLPEIIALLLLCDPSIPETLVTVHFCVSSTQVLPELPCEFLHYWHPNVSRASGILCNLSTLLVHPLSSSDPGIFWSAAVCMGVPESRNLGVSTLESFVVCMGV